MYSPRELEVFRFCFQLLADGCKSSFDAERALRRTFWWVTNLDAERFVKRFCRERSKIEEALGYWNGTTEIQNVHNLSQGTLAPGDPCCSSS